MAQKYTTSDGKVSTIVSDEDFSRLHNILDKGFEDLFTSIVNGNYDYFGNLKSRYGLTDDDIELLRPYIDSSASDSDINSIISEILGKRQAQEHTEAREDSAIARGVSQQLAAGINPNLSGAAAAGASPAEAPALAGLSSGSAGLQNTSGSLSQKFDGVFNTLFKFITLGIQGYGLVSNFMMKDGLSVAGAAAEDVAGILDFGENGQIQDVPSALQDMLSKRGYTGRRKNIYMREFLSRANSLPSVLQRLQSQNGILNFQNKNFEESVKLGKDYRDNLSSFIQSGMKMQAFMQETDLKIAKEKEQFRIKHNLTEQELELALRGQVADTELKEKEVQLKDKEKDIKEAELAGKKLDNSGKELDNVFKETRNASQVSDEEINALKRSISQQELEGLDEMIRFCHKWEFLQTNYDNYTDMGFSSRKAYDDAKYRYKRYKKYVDYWYKNRREGSKASISTPIGSVNFPLD